jgi:hypothetical protein
MSGNMDVVARGARAKRLGRDFRWPGDRRVAVIFDVVYEAWSDGKPPASVRWRIHCPPAHSRAPGEATVPNVASSS